MKQNHRETDTVSEFLSAENREDLDLDLELKRMADETPPVPEDFHARWTERIRAEAAAQQPAAPEAEPAALEAESAAPEAEPAAPEAKPAAKESRRQWRYVLSAAAVFVFLIAGTLLTRNNPREDGSRTSSAAENQVNSEVRSGAGSLASNAAAPAEDAQVLADLMQESWEAEEAVEAEESWAAGTAAPEALGSAPEEAPTAAPRPQMTSAPAAKAAAPAEVNEAPLSLAAGEAPETEAPAEKAAPAGYSLGEETVSFMKDMAVFAWKVLPWAIGAAALAFLVALVDRLIREKWKK